MNIFFAAGAVIRLAELDDEKLSFNVDAEPDAAADAGVSMSMSMNNLSHLSSAAIRCGRRKPHSLPCTELLERLIQPSAARRP